MNKIMSFLACICIVWVFVEFQFLVDDPKKFFVGESFACRLCRQTTALSFFRKDISNFLFDLRGGDGGDGLGSR